MKDNIWIVWVIALVVLTIIIVSVRLILSAVQKKRGVYVHNKVDSILKRYGVIRNFKILRDFTLSADGESVHVEHALIGFFGIIFLTAKGETADFYGDRKDEQWLMIKDEKKTKIENPIAKNEKAMSIARAILGQHKIYSVPMEGLVVFSGNEKKTTIYCADNTIIRYKNLSKYLNKAKFDKDNEIDVDVIEKLFLESSSQSAAK